MELLN
jgi:ubiquitin-protein ligase E3 A